MILKIVDALLALFVLVLGSVLLLPPIEVNWSEYDDVTQDDHLL